MSDRSLSVASWVAFVAFAAMLYLVSSCARDSSTSEPADSAPAATTTSPSIEERVADDPDADDLDAAEDSDADDPDAADEPPVTELPPEGNPELLSEWGQLGVRGGQLVTLDGVTPYTLNSALFSDGAQKLRTVWIPEGDVATYDPERPFDFPVGTVLTKTFYYPVPEGAGAGDAEVLQIASEVNTLAAPLDLTGVRLIETRVLVHRRDGWHALPYVWSDDETEARLRRTGDLVQLAAIAEDGTEAPLPYVVPDVNQCANCHAVDHTSGNIEPIGPAARHLNGDVDYGDGPESQLEHWRDRGLLAFAPAVAEMPRAARWDDESESVEDRARAYLDINCAHCHNPAGAADTSGLFLDIDTEVGYEFGVCKPPIAAGTGSGGRLVDIAPGRPEESILVFRMETTDPAAMMPELGRSHAHDEGVDLISAWIETLDGEC